MLMATAGMAYLSLRLPLVAGLLSFSLWFLMVAWFCRNLSVSAEHTSATRATPSQAETLGHPLVFVR